MKSETTREAWNDPKIVLADTLYSRILTLQLAPGVALNELALCEEFGLSRSTVRTTLLQLAADGLLELRSNRSPTVVTLSPMTLVHFQQSAPLIYIAAVRLAALNARPTDISRLRSLHGCLTEALHEQNLEAWLSLDNVLHREVGQLAANDYLSPGLRRLQIDHGRLCRSFYNNQPLMTLHQDLSADSRAWQQIIDAIAANDCEGAAQLVRAGLDTLCLRLSGHLEPLNKEPPLTSVTVLRSTAPQIR